LRGTNPDGVLAWTEPDAVRYEARHPIGTKARLAFDLLLYTGVRRSDVVKLGPQMERWFTETLPDGKTVEVQKLVFTETRLGQPDGISPSRMAEMLEVDKAGPKVRC
jgi:integrase